MNNTQRENTRFDKYSLLADGRLEELIIYANRHSLIVHKILLQFPKYTWLLTASLQRTIITLDFTPRLTFECRLVNEHAVTFRRKQRAETTTIINR